MLITPQQSRAARALLGWSQSELANRSSVSRDAIANFELGGSTPTTRTYRDLISAFEGAGLVFLPAVEGVHNATVAPMWNSEDPALKAGGAETKGKRGSSGLKALDQEMANYWAERPERWASLSPSGRRALSVEIFGDPIAADEAFGNERAAP